MVIFHFFIFEVLSFITKNVIQFKKSHVFTCNCSLNREMYGNATMRGCGTKLQCALVFPFYSTRLARQKFYLEKKISSESSRVKFKNGIHSTRSSFHCFVSSEFRVLIEYF